MPSFRPKANRICMSNNSGLIIILLLAGCGNYLSSLLFRPIEAFIPSHVAVVGGNTLKRQQLLLSSSRHTSPAFATRLYAKDWLTPEFSVVGEGNEEEEYAYPSQNQKSLNDNNTDKSVDDDDDEDEDGFELQYEMTDEMNEDEDILDDEEEDISDTAGAMLQMNRDDDNKEQTNQKWSVERSLTETAGEKCLGALLVPPSGSSSSSSANVAAAAAVVTIQVGDVHLARKAWKKRRRSGSPMLVPCSILHMDPRNLIRCNLMYLLYKYGTDSKTSTSTTQQRPGLEIPMSEVARFHKTQFKTSLLKFANAMGFDSPQQMVESVMDESFQQRQGIYLLSSSSSGESTNMRLWTPSLTRRRAHQRVMEHAVLLEFVLEGDDNDDDDSSNEPIAFVKHTGRIRDTTSRQETTDASSTTATSTSSSLGKKKHTMAPLSAALRVGSQASLVNLPSGSIHLATVFGFDTHGDGGLPLLTLSLVSQDTVNSTKSSSSSQRGKSDGKLPSEQQQKQFNWMDLKPCQYALHELHVGQGPFDATVVHVSKGGTAFVDAQVGRRASSASSQRRGQQKQADALIPVVGMLRKQDTMQNKQYIDEDDDSKSMLNLQAATALDDYDDDEEEETDEEDISFLYKEIDDDADDDDDDDLDDDALEATEEDVTQLFKLAEDADGDDLGDDDDDDDDEEGETIEEDVTHLFEFGEDGTIVYKNPETGETEIFQMDEDDEEELESTVEAKQQLKIDSVRSGKTMTMETKSGFSTKTKAGTVQMSKRKGFESSKDFIESDYKPSQLQVGDKVQVYVKAISKQSGRFMVTMDPTVRKPKDVKREHVVEKKMARLAQQLGGSLDRITQLRGRECSGIVKATSHSSGWLYVQPQFENLPVGVATLSPSLFRQGDDVAENIIQAGDAVRIRLDGIDEVRGQLAMTVLEKLAP